MKILLGLVKKVQGVDLPPREETSSLQVVNTSKYVTQSLRSKSLHETQNPALVDCFCPRPARKETNVQPRAYCPTVACWFICTANKPSLPDKASRYVVLVVSAQILSSTIVVCHSKNLGMLQR